jgi:N4-gp56 family major capsid protein
MADSFNVMETSYVTDEQKTFYERALLKRLVPNLVYAKYGQKKILPKNEGATINFRRFNEIEATVKPLEEGQSPRGVLISMSRYEAKLEQYGNFVAITDMLDMTGIDPVLTDAAEALGETAGLTADTIVRNVICKGTNVQYAKGRESVDEIKADDVMTAAEIKKAVCTLRMKNAKPFEDGCFVGIIDPAVAFDLMDDPLWQDVSKYNGGEAILKGEIGKLCGVRFVETTNAPTQENDEEVDIHTCMILGQDAYGVVDLEGSGPEIIIKPVGSAGASDPLNQRATVGYKLTFTAVRLNELAMIRVMCASAY